MRYDMYVMVIEPLRFFPGEGKAERRTYHSKHQGAAPPGYRCVGVCGGYDIPKNSTDGGKNL